MGRAGPGYLQPARASVRHPALSSHCDTPILATVLGTGSGLISAGRLAVHLSSP